MGIFVRILNEKVKEFLSILEKSNYFTAEQWRIFEKRLDCYLETLSEDDRKKFTLGERKEIFRQLVHKRDGVPIEPPVKNLKTREFIKRILCTDEHTTDKEFLQLRRELIAHLRTLSKEECDEFAQLGYGEMLEMCCPPE